VDEQTLADVVSELLAAKGLSLAVAETTTHGALAQQCCDASQGERAFIGGVTLSSTGNLRDALGLEGEEVAPGQALANAAARAVRARYGADLGLALVGPYDPALPDAPPVYFSLAAGAELVEGESRQGRAGPAGRGWLVHLALDLVRRHLLT
jgi:nicotinamide-nucleotide amidase